ncbi:MAG TPA: bifunctional enoyl-CoA hydratase/phosphate acetyltransferase [Alphaproteobacteria bacterium]|nr:bifunctional enoyl-CoA hydratase/phosphate acetyltransferase [Alphaproteobacteria bacterium]
MRYIENKTFDEIKIGDSAELVRTLTKKDIEVFAVMSGDVNPAHVDKEYAESDLFHRIVVQGIWGGALISNVLGTELPGPGAIYLGQTLTFKKPISIGDKITVKVTAQAKNSKKKEITFLCSITNQRSEEVTSGTAVILAPTEKIRRPRIELGEIVLRKPGELYEDLLKILHKVKPVKTAVVHPVDDVSLLGAIESAQAKIIIPILIGPEDKIRSVAKALKLDLSPYKIISTPHSTAAAELGVSLSRKGEVDALMKGALHTDELMHAVVDKETGISTERRISHVFVMDIPTYPRLMLVSDAAINIDPTLEEKKDITQNAIDLAHDIGIKLPKVAIISAVETVTPKIQSTLDAAALCKMADRRQITGGILDGPLAFDNVVSKEAAKIKGIISPVAGQADVVIVPDLVSGNILVKQLEYLSNAQSAGVVLGAKVPIILTSRSDAAIARLASSALAAIMVYQKLTSKGKKT